MELFFVQYWDATMLTESDGVEWLSSTRCLISTADSAALMRELDADTNVLSYEACHGSEADQHRDRAALAAEIAATERLDAEAAELLATRIYDAVIDYADAWNEMVARSWSRQCCEGLALAA